MIINLGYFLLVGIYFALLQFSYFFIMSFNLSSSYISYISMVFAWIMGAVCGIWLKNKKWERRLLILSSISYYLFVFIASKLRFSNHLYFFFFMLVLVSGVYSGYFFSLNSKRPQKIKWLFFMENNGFILGSAASFIAFTMLGLNFLYFAPLAITVCLWAMSKWCLADIEV